MPIVLGQQVGERATRRGQQREVGRGATGIGQRDDAGALRYRDVRGGEAAIRTRLEFRDESLAIFGSEPAGRLQFFQAARGDRAAERLVGHQRRAIDFAGLLELSQRAIEERRGAQVVQFWARRPDRRWSRRGPVAPLRTAMLPKVRPRRAFVAAPSAARSARAARVQRGPATRAAFSPIDVGRSGTTWPS